MDLRTTARRRGGRGRRRGKKAGKISLLLFPLSHALSSTTRGRAPSSSKHELSFSTPPLRYRHTWPKGHPPSGSAWWTKPRGDRTTGTSPRGRAPGISRRRRRRRRRRRCCKPTPTPPTTTRARPAAAAAATVAVVVATAAAREAHRHRDNDVAPRPHLVKQQQQQQYQHRHLW